MEYFLLYQEAKDVTVSRDDGELVSPEGTQDVKTQSTGLR